MTNFIMNAGEIAVSSPMAPVTPPYPGVVGRFIVFASTVTADMLFLFCSQERFVSNAVAHDYRRFQTSEFFLYGIPASDLLVTPVASVVAVARPIMGMQTTLPINNGPY